MVVDRSLGLSSYFMYRYGFDENVSISEKYPNHIEDISFPRDKVKTSADLGQSLRKTVEQASADGKAALALSGGIDSAILAKYMPEGSAAYTFRCVVPGVEVVDETPRAAFYAESCNLDHRVIDITWEDVERVVEPLIAHKGGPIHSIEAQIYLAALRAKEEGFERIIFGENADIIYGGMNGLLEKDWLFGEFVDRYSYVKPYHVLKDPKMPLAPFLNFEVDGHIDGHDFINTYFRQEALGTYNNACDTAGIKFVGPYSLTVMDTPIDYDRIRAGETKYLIRELFNELYEGAELPEKIPMPRPVNEWFARWEGPVRPEFLPHCTDNMTGDQKWMVWCAERFLDLVDRG